MYSKIYMKRKIIIIGDAGRGKTTLAEKLARKHNIKFYSTDDFIWKKRFTEMYGKKESKEKITKIFEKGEWIVEGGSLRLLEDGIGKADIIIYLGFKNIFSQYFALYKRYVRRKSVYKDYENTKSFLNMLRHITYKRFKLRYKKDVPTMLEVLKPHKEKVIELYSIEEINRLSL